MSIKPVSSTMGKSSPATVASGTGYYRYRGNQPYQGPDERSALARDGSRMSAQKAARFTEFCRLTEQEQLSVAEAAERIGIAVNTAEGYNRQRKRQRREQENA